MIFIEPERQILIKIKKIFKLAPWLKDSDNVIHIPISGMDNKDGLTWKELYVLIDSIMME